MSKSRQGAPRRAAAGLLAGALAVVGIALAPPAGARADATADRIAGATRYGTAAAVAGQPDFDGATTAILASGENFPDALAASGLAGANSPAPIILTESDNLTDETRVALSELGSLDDIIVVGGTAAVSDEVVTAVEDEGFTVTRLAGNDRYETAAAIAGEVTAGEIDGLTTALIASGEVFADALAGGPIAAAAGLPILLVNAEGIPAATEAALDDIEQVIILGGTARITDETETELEGITGNDAVRVAGQDRFETATLIASTLGEGELGWAPETVLLASGLNFPDALAAGPFGGIRQAPIVLTASVPAITLSYLDGVSDTLRQLIAIGGTAAVSEEDLQTALTEGAQNVDNDAATGGDTQTSALAGPELQSAAISDIDLEELAIVYTFTFDQDLDEDILNPELFKLYNYDTRTWASGDVFNGGDDLNVDGEQVEVVFNLADYGVANATLAAVAEGAVEDAEGNPNPPQSVATSGIGNSAGTGLVSARVVDAEDGVVEFVFGSPTVAPGSNIYELVTRDGVSIMATDIDDADGAGAFLGNYDFQTVYPATVETHPDEDEASTTVRVTFECNGDQSPDQYDNADQDADTTDDPCEDAADGDGADLSDLVLRRANVIGSTGRIQSAELSSGGNTNGPDLAGVTFASDEEDLDDNQALFVFDEALDTAPGSLADPGAFRLAYSHCSPSAPGSINDLIGDSNDATEDDYPTQDGQGWSDSIDLGSTCLLTATDAEFSADTQDDFGNRSVLVTFDAAAVVENEFLVAAQVGGDGGGEDTDGGNSAAELTGRAIVEGITGDADVYEAGNTGLDNNNDEVELNVQPASVYDDGEVAGPQLTDATVEVDTGFGDDFQGYTLTLTFDKEIDEDSLDGPGAIKFWYEDAEQVEFDEIDLGDCDVDDDVTIVCEFAADDPDDLTFSDAVVVSIDHDTVQSADTFTLDDGQEEESFPNPEASIEVEIPSA